MIWNLTINLKQTLPSKSHILLQASPNEAGPMVVGLGASAGGIRALQRFFAALSAPTGFAFVVVVHLSPEHESHLAEVLQPHTAMPVEQVRSHVRMEPDHVYVIPPNMNLQLTDGHLTLTDFGPSRFSRAPIDVFFRTLAEAHPDCIAILLSGGGADGTLGIKAIKEYGGLVMAQSPEEAEVEAMPRSAIATGLVDFILPTAELAAKVVELSQHDARVMPAQRPEALPESEEDALGNILRVLQTRTGHDFSGYKPATVLRRLDRRMRVAQMDSLFAYFRYLQGHPHEAQVLLKDLLISVTTFFRDAAAFEALREQVIPRLFEGKGAGDEVRVWIPGCASGEEAYSIAMLLMERLDALTPSPRLQLFACDLDEDALAYAREGLYPETITADVDEARLHRFFVREGGYYRVKKRAARYNFIRPSQPAQRTAFFPALTSSRAAISSSTYNAICKKRWPSCSTTPSGRRVSCSWAAPRVSTTSATCFARSTKPIALYRSEPFPAPRLAHLPDLPLSMTSQGRVAPFRTRPVSPPSMPSDAELHREMLEAHAPPSLLVDADANIVHVSETANRYLQFPSGTPSPNLYRAILPDTAPRSAHRPLPGSGGETRRRSERPRPWISAASGVWCSFISRPPRIKKRPP